MKHLRTSTVIAALCATVLVRLAVSGRYSQYVQAGMRIPLLVAGSVLGFLAVLQLTGATEQRDTSHHHDDHRTPAVAWLLLLPVLAVLVVAPPPLGGWGLNRQSNQQDRGLQWSPLMVTSGRATSVPLPDYVGRALEEGSPTVADLEVELIGFVGERSDTSFVLARYSIACCAADALAFQVNVIGASIPPVNSDSNNLQWVRVVGTLKGVDGSVPQLEAKMVTVVPQPTDPYI